MCVCDVSTILTTAADARARHRARRKLFMILGRQDNGTRNQMKSFTPVVYGWNADTVVLVLRLYLNLLALFSAFALTGDHTALDRLDDKNSIKPEAPHGAGIYY